jgi:3-methyladenine DNA glycosylase AlkD
MATFKSLTLDQIQSQFPEHRNARAAHGAHAYMKGIAPFIGIDAPGRRKILREIFKELPTPTSEELGTTARALWKLPEREYQYAASDLIDHFIDCADKNFLKDHVEYLIANKSWWDTVDSLGSTAVSPLTMKFQSVTLMRKWNKSSNMWLVRASIQHQRGRKSETDIPLLIEFMNRHSSESEFFIAKAIGWALRDLSRINNLEVKKFLEQHPELDRVAVREALKLGYK